MKKHTHILRIIIACLFIAAMCAATFRLTLKPQETATDIKSKTIYDDGQEHREVYGYSAEGKKVWTWTTRSYETTEIDATSCIDKRDYVYVIERQRYVRLKKSNGKVMAAKDTNYASPGPAMAVDDEGYLYCAGFYSDRIVKFDQNGEAVAIHTVPVEYDAWPYKITIDGDKLKVYFDMNGHVLTIKKSNLEE